MKKVFSFLLVLTLVLSMSTFALADVWSHEESGIVIDLPDGMTGEDNSEGDLISLYVESDAEDAPLYYVYLAFDEDYAGMWMEDLDEEGLQLVAEGYALNESDYTYTVANAGDITMMVMMNDDGTEMMVVALLNGWFVSVEAYAPEDMVLAEGAYNDVGLLLVGIALPE